MYFSVGHTILFALVLVGRELYFFGCFIGFFALLEINLSLCQTNGVSYFIGC